MRASFFYFIFFLNKFRNKLYLENDLRIKMSSFIPDIDFPVGGEGRTVSKISLNCLSCN